MRGVRRPDEWADLLERSDADREKRMRTGQSERAGPTSTLTGALLLNLLLMEIVEYLSRKRLPLPLLVSANSSPDARARNEKMVSTYRHRLHLPI